MYLIAAPHPNKDTTRRLLEQVINRRDRLVADAEVLQEILHRYVAINRREAIQPAFDALLRIVDHVYPVKAADIERAKTLLLGLTPLSEGKKQRRRRGSVVFELFCAERKKLEEPRDGRAVPPSVILTQTHASPRPLCCFFPSREQS